MVAACLNMSVYAATYTVAGSSTDVFGTSWDPTNTANDMSLTDGLYRFEKADVTLPDGKISFKVVQDHAWTNAWPSSDYDLLIPSDGVYTISITFNESTKDVAATATKTGEAVVLPTIKMHGNFSGSWSDTEAFTDNGDGTASLTIAVGYGNYEFGMKINDTWTSNGVAFSRSNASAQVVSGSGNLTLATDVAGDYTFVWTYETRMLAITFPAEPDEPVLPTMQIAGAWNIVDDAWVLNAMTDAGGVNAVYSVNIETPGEYEFKMIKNGQWLTKATGGDPYGLHRAWPGVAGVTNDATENLKVRADVKGTYTFTWTYANDSIGITFPSVKAKGTWDEWANDVVFTPASDGWSASATISLNAATYYNFKMVLGDEWRSNGYVYHRNYTYAENITEDATDNMTLMTDVAGDYTITWSFGANSVSVTFPDPNYSPVRSGLEVGRFYTICYNHAMTAVQGATFWSFISRDASFAYLTQEYAPFTEGKPYIIQAEATELTAVLGPEASSPGVNGALHGTFTNLVQENLDGGENIYLLINNTLRRVDGQSNNTLAAYRAYVDLDEIPNNGAPANVPAERLRRMPMQTEVATGIEDASSANCNAESRKVLRDGKLYIIRSNKTYNAQGQEVK